MGFMIEDGTGNGFRTGVTSENQLLTQAENHELQHHISITQGQVYQAIGTHTLSTSGTKTVLHINNDDASRYLVVSYMRVQFTGGGTIDENTYFQCGFDTVYNSGGGIITPVNMNAISGNVATVTAYNDNPTVTGSLSEFDRWYGDKNMEVFNKHGSIIMGLNDTIEWRLVTDQTAGVAYARVTMMMLDRSTG